MSVLTDIERGSPVLRPGEEELGASFVELVDENDCPTGYHPTRSEIITIAHDAELGTIATRQLLFSTESTNRSLEFDGLRELVADGVITVSLGLGVNLKPNEFEGGIGYDVDQGVHYNPATGESF